jgi:hypothetical protein
MSNYHLMTDLPENLDYATIANAARLAYGVAQALASEHGVSPDGAPGT